jgi:hypothetical protein
MSEVRQGFVGRGTVSCGTKIDGMSWGWSDEIADSLERDGESALADKVRRQECLGWMDLRRAETALDR